MLERDRGGVLNVASTAAFQPLATMAVYAATKAFVLSFTEALWAETTTGVRVMALCPGATETGFFDAAGKEFLTRGRQSADYVAGVRSAELLQRPIPQRRPRCGQQAWVHRLPIPSSLCHGALRGGAGAGRRVMPFSASRRRAQ